MTDPAYTKIKAAEKNYTNFARLANAFLDAYDYEFKLWVDSIKTINLLVQLLGMATWQQSQ